MKYAGVGMGSVCLLCDVGKGFVPVFVAAQQLERTGLLFSLLIAAPVAGHAFSPWKREKGESYCDGFRRFARPPAL